MAIYYPFSRIIEGLLTRFRPMDSQIFEYFDNLTDNGHPCVNKYTSHGNISSLLKHFRIFIDLISSFSFSEFG